MTKFVYIGRLSVEKGILQILTAIDHLISQKVSFELHIYGSGPLLSDIQDHSAYNTYIYCHGRLPKQDTMQAIQHYDYSIVASQFLETFGLTALDSLAMGLPVVCEEKGGLSQFVVSPILQIKNNNDLGNILYNLTQLDPDIYLELQHKSLILAQKYTSNIRYQNLKKLLKNDIQNILCISDYAIDIGGIESYILEVQKILGQKNILVDIYGKTKRASGIYRKLDLVTSGFNLWAIYQIYHILKNKKYDTIWIHSISRRLGVWPLIYLYIYRKHHNIQIITMYHDFGLIHPFPSAVYSESQLQNTYKRSIYHYEAKKVLGYKYYIGGFVIISLKFLYSKMLLYILSCITDIHLVPSDYMIMYFQKALSQGVHISTLSHFVSHSIAQIDGK